MKNINSEYYGDETRWFVGTVVNSSPPPGLEGRVRIRIHGIHDPYTGNVRESDLPWAQVALPLTEGGSSGIGRIPQVLPGAFIYGIFIDGKSSQLPMIIGSLTKLEYPTTVQIQSSKDKTLSQFKNNYNPDRLLNTVSQGLEDDSKPTTIINRRRSQCMIFFIDNGYTPRQAAGITGCLESVSQFRTFDEKNQTPELYGIAKWVRTGTRYNNLVKFAGQFTTRQSYSLFSVQLQFVLFELRTLFANANAKLLTTELIDGNKGSVNVISKYYLKNRFIAGGGSGSNNMNSSRRINLAVQLATQAFDQSVNI